MGSFFTPDFFVGNRRNLRQQIKLAKGELAVVPAHFKLQKSHDEAFEFTQDSNFFYLSGIKEPDCVLIITSDSEVLLSPNIKAHHQLWEGQASVDEMKQISGILDIQTGQTGLKTFKALVSASSKVYVPLPYDSRTLRNYFRMVPNPARRALIRKIKSFKADIKIEDLRPTLSSLRMVKQPSELKAIQKAIDITMASIKTVQRDLPNLQTERDVHALLEYEFKRHGADGPSFGSIIASGANTAQIHYMGNDHTVIDRNLLLLDVGAQVEGYKSDISRVLSQAERNPRQQQIYDAVLSLQEYAKSLLRPGVNLLDYEDMVDKKTVAMVKKLRLTTHQTLRHRQRVIPHAVSHHLGLDTHDAADYKVPLQPGMVLTVEPGIYLLEEGIGIRIEDDVLITEKGCKVLSSGLK